MLRWMLIILCLFTFQNDETVLTWNAKSKLTWHDFKDRPNPKIDAVALTASGITFGYSISRTDSEVNSFKTEVHAHFYPNKSWFKPHKADAYILAHEQLHFDITELHARKFRQQLQRIKVSNSIRAELDGLHERINKQLADMQDLYDAETNFSRIPKAQLKWHNFINSELKRLERYKLAK